MLLLSLINDILDITRIETGQAPCYLVITPRAPSILDITRIETGQVTLTLTVTLPLVPILTLTLTLTLTPTLFDRAARLHVVAVGCQPDPRELPWAEVSE